jgi:hypothetical protein
MRITVLVPLVIGLVACGIFSRPEPTVHSAIGPAFNELIIQQLQFDYETKVSGKSVVDNNVVDTSKKQNFFAYPEQFGSIEISSSRSVWHNTDGLTWAVCLRANPEGQQPRYYSIFIINQSIVDVRTAVLTDNCSAQTYKPLGWIPHDAGKSSLSPGSVGVAADCKSGFSSYPCKKF